MASFAQWQKKKTDEEETRANLAKAAQEMQGAKTAAQSAMPDWYKQDVAQAARTAEEKKAAIKATEPEWYRQTVTQAAQTAAEKTAAKKASGAGQDSGFAKWQRENSFVYQTTGRRNFAAALEDLADEVTGSYASRQGKYVSPDDYKSIYGSQGQKLSSMARAAESYARDAEERGDRAAVLEYEKIGRWARSANSSLEAEQSYWENFPTEESYEDYRSALERAAYLATSQRPQTYTRENLSQYRDRVKALADTPQWTQEDAQEAAEINSVLGNMKPRDLVSEYGVEDYATWTDLQSRLGARTKPNAATGIASNFASGAGVNSLMQAISAGAEKLWGKDAQYMSRQAEAFRQAGSTYAQQHPVMGTAANIAGNLVLYTSIGEVVGAALSPLSATISAPGTGLVSTAAQAAAKAPAASKAAQTLIRTAASAVNFMIGDAVRGAGEFAEGNVSGKEYGLGILKSGLTGAATGLASNLVRLGADKIINRYRLTTPLTYFTKEVASGLAGGGTYAGMGYALASKEPTSQWTAAYLMQHPEAEEAEIRQAYKDNLKKTAASQFMVGFLTTMVQSAITTARITEANKKVFGALKSVFEQQGKDTLSTLEGLEGDRRDEYLARSISNVESAQEQLWQWYNEGQEDFTLSVGERKAFNEISAYLSALRDFLAMQQGGGAEAADFAGAPSEPAGPAGAAADTQAATDLANVIGGAMQQGVTAAEGAAPIEPAPAPDVPDIGPLAGAAAAGVPVQAPYVPPEEITPPTVIAPTAPAEQPETQLPEAPATVEDMFRQAAEEMQRELEAPAPVAEDTNVPTKPQTKPEPPAAEPKPPKEEPAPAPAPVRSPREIAAELGMGENGADYFTKMMAKEPNVNPGEFLAYWNAGHAGEPFGDVETSMAGSMTPAQQKIAWNAGQMDAIKDGTALQAEELAAEAVAKPEQSGYTKPAASEPTRETVPTETVEQAKKELKAAIKMPVQGTNEQALAAGAKSGELSMDSITISGRADGFTPQQQESLIRQIIEGAGTGDRTIKVDVPLDGKFEINNTPDAIAKVLNRLKAKANQEIFFDTKTNAWLKGAQKTFIVTAGGQKFITDGYAALALTDAAAEYAQSKEGYGAEVRSGDMPVDVDHGEQVTVQPKIATLPKTGNVYVFETGNGRMVFDKRLIDRIDVKNGSLEIVPYAGGKASVALTRNADGTIKGFSLAVRAQDIPSTGLKQGKLKSIGNKPAEKKKEDNNGGNNEGVDQGREDLLPGESGRRGLQTAGHAPAEGKGVPDDSQRGKSGLRPDEGVDRKAGERGGGHDDTVRHEPGINVRGAGQGDGQAVPGVEKPGAEGAELRGPAGSGGSGNAAVEKKAGPRNKNNFRINEETAQKIDATRPSYGDNFAAVRLLKDLLASGRKPTPEEMAVLAKFKGWGGLKDILNEQGYYGRQLKQLLTKEEYEAAKLSTLTAHYTSTKVIGAMYDAVKRLGFTGGRVLEPSMGVGYFFGAMPDKLARSSDLYGVEMDGITGNIAKLLYPDAKIDVAGFQDVLYPDGTFDLVIGNVPFSNEVKLPYRNTTYNLHDFFFVKALDETRPGGIAALITSTGTLDKISGKTQRAISERANLIAAFRLPDTAFKGNAGTEVTTDLIFLQKKGPGIEDNGIEFEKIGEIDGIPINEYYVEHPKNILGKLAYEKGMYAGDRAVVHGISGQDIGETLAEALKTLPKNIMNGAAQTGGARPVTAKKRGERSRPNFKVNTDGEVTITDSETGETIEYGDATKAEKEKADTIKGYIGIRDTLRELMETERAGGDGSQLREKLNEQYDAFKKAHGPLSEKSNKKLLAPDGDYIQTSGIEIKAKDGYKKSDIFRVPTLSKQRKTHADTSSEALSIALNESGRVNLDRIRELTGKTLDQTLNDLKDDIILTPDGDYQLVTQYASGNIYEKLDRIKDRPEFDRQRKLLEKALPRRRTADEIDAELGSHWIEPKYINEFLAKTFETNAAVEYSKELGRWALRLGWSGVSRYRTNRVTSQEVAEATLNGKNVEVFDKTSDGKRIYNKEESELAQSKQDMLREDFRSWVFKDKDRAAALVDTFNRTLNAYAPMDYSGLSARMEFNVNPESKKQPREYQKEAAARIVYGGNTLLHNGVGTGKTLTMVLAAHMLKEAGIANKPMFVVPNGKVEDFRSEYLQAYPDAKILALDNEAMSPKQIQATKAMIATGDWDCVIVYRTAFQRMPLSPEAEKAALQRQLDLYEQAARDQAGQRNGSRMFEKGLAARKASLEARIKKVMDKAHDDTTYFDEMGVDALFVDEAHNYKKVGFPTTFKYSGIVADTNEITTDLYMKEELLRDRGNRIVLATATPITNAISEMYNMAMHVAPEVYQAAGIYSFDTWANTFVNIESQAEIASDGKTFQMKERARNFKNANAMFGLYRQFADIKQTKDYVKDLPEAEVVTVTSEATDLHKQILAYLSNLPPDKTLQMNNDGRAAASDLRLATELLAEMGLNMSPEELDLPGSKINRAVSAIVDEYQKSGEIKGTQFVFLDQGVNSGGKRYSFNLYDDLIGKLAKAGIPKNEIAKIGDYDGEDKRQILYDKMNKGEIRVLIGSTAKMGEGVNAQERAVALHHLSVPYRPDNLEQREGRIVRSGNINKKVRIYKYIQEESYDSYLWQMIERKAAYLAEAYNGGDATEVDELSEAQVNAREAKAIATGNPLIMEKMSLQDKIARLKALQRGWRSEQADAERTLGISKEKLKEAEEKARNAVKDIETYKKAAAAQSDDFRIEISGKEYETRKDAAEALDKAVKKNKLGKLGTVFGFEFGLRYDSKLGEAVLYVKGQNEYFNSLGDSSMGNITRITNLAEKGPVSAKANFEQNVQVYTSAIKDAKTTLGSSFKQQKDLDAATKRMREIDAELGITGHGQVIETEETEAVNSLEEPVLAAKTEAGDNTPKNDAAFPRPERWTTTRAGDENKTPMRVSDIVEKIRHDYHINITKGHVTGKKTVRGQYRPGNPGIRTREALDLPTISHELGHHLDNLYGLEDLLNGNDAALGELMAALPEGFQMGYKEKELPAEGIAEYFRRYLTNKETAAIDCPKFTKLLKETLSAPEAAMLDELADEINAYYALDADTATSSIRRIEDSRRDFRSWKEKLKDTAHVLYQAVVDSNDSIKRFDEEMGTSVYKFASNAAYADDRAGQLIIGDLRDIDGEYVGPGLKTVLHGLDMTDKNEFALFGEYLVVRHAPERMAEGMRIVADDRKNNAQWMNKRQAAIEAEHPEFKEISDRLYAFRRQMLQTWGVDTGLVNQDAADAWLDRWHYAVPLNRAVDINSRAQGAKRGFVNQSGPFKKARGSGLDIINPVDNIISEIIKLVHLSIYNDVALQLADACQKEGAPAWWMERIPPPKVATKISTEPFKEQLRGLSQEALDTMDDDAITAAMDGFMELILEKADDVLTQYSNRRPSGNIVTVLRAGKPEYWKVNDPQMLKTLSGMKRGTVSGVLEAYGTISRFMTGNITGRNVVWSIFSNAPRDLGTFFAYSKERNPLKVFPAMASAYVNKARGDKADPIYLEYLSMGGGNTSAYSNDVDVVRRARKKLEGRKFDGNPLHWLEWVSDVVEMGPRFATYKLMRQAGMSTHEAFYEATDITVNFRRGGDISRQINRLVPFFNAGVQGADKFARWATAQDIPKEDREKAIFGRVLAFFAVSAALAGANYAINHYTKEREEDYKRLSTYTKNSYWNIPIGDGRFFSITKPRELGVLSSYMEASLERYVAGNSHAFDGFYEYATDVFLPGGMAELAQGDWQSAVGSLGILGVSAYMMANRDFLGRPIVSQGMANLEPKLQYDNRTSVLAKAIGDAFNVSPKMTDYFFEQTLGGWWKYQRALFPVGSEQRDLTLGVKNQYIKDSLYSTDLTNRMYDRAEASKKAYNTDKTDAEKELEYKMDSRMTDFYGSYYKLAKNQPETDKTRALRNTVLAMVEDYEKTRESGEWPEIFERIKKVGAGDMGTYLPSTVNTVIKDTAGAAHELSAEQYVEYQTDYNRLYYSVVEQSVKAATTDKELAAILKGAKETAADKAKSNALKRIGAPTEASKYGDVADTNVAIYRGLLDIADDDGSLKQAEVIDAIKQMQKENGLSRGDAYLLFKAKYDSDKNNPWAPGKK